jgi:hypothetical protein
LYNNLKTPFQSNNIKDYIMAWDEPIQFNHGVDKMVDTVIAQPQDGMFGGGTLGAVLLGSLLPRLVGNGADAAAVAASQNNAGTNQILQALNQGQNATSTQIITQDVNRLGRDVANSAAGTQAAIAASTLNSTVATLQGQNGITSTIANAAADITAGVNNSRNGVVDAINQATGILDADLHGLASNITAGMGAITDNLNRSTLANLQASHANEVATLTSAYGIQTAITNDGSKTRDLINAYNVADLNRQIVVAENRVAELLGDNRHARSTADIIINNNNNATAVATAMQQQQQQQQLSTLAGTLNNLLGHVQSINQTVVNTGTMRGNALTPVQA